jgi:DNA adenine methylase
VIRSILRYPGGKSKVAHKIVSLIPPNIKEFREPMVGGGSVSLVLKQTFPHVKVWINDLSYDLSWELQYGMTAKKGKELFTTNYKTG